MGIMINELVHMCYGTLYDKIIQSRNRFYAIRELWLKRGLNNETDICN